MTDTLFDIIFSGKILQGQEMAQVRQAVAAIFKADDAMLDRLFSGDPVRIKSAVDQETAIKYRITFRQAGAMIDIQPTTIEETPPAAPKQAGAENNTDHLTLLPPKTGSLIDCAIEEKPISIGDINYLSLAPEGTVIDETEPPPAIDIDTSELEIDSEP